MICERANKTLAVGWRRGTSYSVGLRFLADMRKHPGVRPGSTDPTHLPPLAAGPGSLPFTPRRQSFHLGLRGHAQLCARRQDPQRHGQRDARKRVHRRAGNVNGDKALLAASLTMKPGEYVVTVSAVSPAGEERKATINVTVDALPVVPLGGLTPPVVLLNGWQFSVLPPSTCPMEPTGSVATFGHLAS